jgi:hypothetical protein
MVRPPYQKKVPQTTEATLNALHHLRTSRRDTTAELAVQPLPPAAATQRITTSRPRALCRSSAMLFLLRLNRG